MPARRAPEGPGVHEIQGETAVRVGGGGAWPDSEPTYAHVPLALAPSGARLAKRDGAVTLSDLRGLGWSTADVVSFIGASLGVPGARCASDIADALGISGLRALPTEPWVVTPPSS